MQRFHAFRSHETRQNVRLAEVAQAPCSGGYGGQPACTFRGKELAVLHAALSDSLRNGGIHFRRTAQRQIHHHRCQNQRKNHQRGLQRIRPAHGQKAADKRVNDGGTRAQPQGGFVAHAFKQALEQLRTRHNAGSAINRKEKQNDGGGNHFHQFAVFAETVREIFGQRQGVVVQFGVHAQPAGHQQPVEIRTDGQADGNPCLNQAGSVNRAGQAHQQPARHIGRAGRHGGNERAEASAAQNIIIKITRGKIGEKTDAQNGHQI